MTNSKERWQSSPGRAVDRRRDGPNARRPGREARPRLTLGRRPRHRRRGGAADGRPRPRPAGRARRRDGRRHGGLDIVVANAGVGAYGPFVELDPAHIDEMMDVNATGVISTAAATVPHLSRVAAATSSRWRRRPDRRGLPFEAVYCASKFAQVGFTRALDHELRV